MATASEVSAQLASIPKLLENSRTKLKNAQSSILGARNSLANAEVVYADLISTVNGYTPSNEFESFAQDALTEYIAERNTLKAELEATLDHWGITY